MRRYIPFFMMMFLLMSVTGCALNKKRTEESSYALLKTTQPTPIVIKKSKKHQVVGDKIERDIEEIPAIYDTAIVENEKRVIVAYKVRHLQRFNMRKIEKKLNKKLESRYPKKQFIVSSDYKIFLEAVRLKEALQSGEISKKEAEKRFKKIISLSSELT
ncbi:YhcN/YlaJ family sporulation lipoprotein [Bacillus chungangensis]|uniref:Sporulation protein n=1 Tax=Bacillus chungangensis TaxID=587633 RepID=A0ABT9WPB8_9BACI|nr:YhcN/YlaJ family sporulation lipoprotein [Bacillus chungangensis]MDQ0174615.1 hypothetical protein [Bacillus chungangensis]